MSYFPKQLCKLFPVQAMKLTKMRQRRLLPYLIGNFPFRQLNNLPPTGGTTEQEILKRFPVLFCPDTGRKINYYENNSDYLKKACKYGQITG